MTTPDTAGTPAEHAPASTEFAGLGLSPQLLEAVAALGYEEPTPIQCEAIPILLAGRDLLGLAATGTGKTAAFALPLLQRIHDQGGGGDVGEWERPIRALVLVPTRELAMQVAEALHKYGRRSLGTNVLPVYGGQDIRQQLKALKRGVDVVVATPGRALDHIKRGSMDLSAVQVVVLDEADEMMDMGFAEDLDAILESLPGERQTALFSATMARHVERIAGKHLRDPARVTIRREQVAEGEAPRVRQTAYLVRREHKVAALGRVLDMEAPTAAMVFCRTRGEVDTLTETLSARGYRAEALHGGMSQEQRDRVMRKFREGAVELLVATDVAARGLDVEHVSHVVNFDVPSAPDAYVHRIGRTGRAGRTGVAITFAEPREQRLLRNIEQLTKQKIAHETVPTIVDLRAKRLEMVRGSIEEALVADDLDTYRVVVESLAREHDLLDVATAAVKVAHEASGGDQPDDERDIPTLEMREAGGGRREAGGARRGSFDRERPPRERGFDRERPPREGRAPSAEGRGPRPRRGDPDATRIYIGVGRGNGVRPADIVGAIANEAGVHSKAIGAIDIADKFTLVEVPGDRADEVIRALKNTTIRGKRPTVRLDRET